MRARLCVCVCMDGTMRYGYYASLDGHKQNQRQKPQRLPVMMMSMREREKEREREREREKKERERELRTTRRQYFANIVLQ